MEHIERIIGKQSGNDEYDRNEFTKMSPADLTVFVMPVTLELDEQELCFLSFERKGRSSPISVRFVDQKTVSSQAAAYRPLAHALSTELQGKVSLWVRAEPSDRIMLVKSLDRPLMEACVRYLLHHPKLDCRIVTVAAVDSLAEHLRNACRLAFAHLPVYADTNVRRSVEYAMSLLRDRAFGKASASPTHRPMSVLKAASGAEDGFATSHLILHSRGAPIRFTAPFVSAGFRINSRIVRDAADGAYLSNAAKGAAIYGPYIPAPPGRYQAVLQLCGDVGKSGSLMARVRGRPSGSIAFDAYLAEMDSVLQVVRVEAAMIGSDPIELELCFEVPHLADLPKLELRLHQQSNKSCIVQGIELAWLGSDPAVSGGTNGPHGIEQ